MRDFLHSIVITGLVPVIHLSTRSESAAWIARTSRAMTTVQ
jgi:hypothetical protein